MNDVWRDPHAPAVATLDGSDQYILDKIARLQLESRVTTILFEKRCLSKHSKIVVDTLAELLKANHSIKYLKIGRHMSPVAKAYLLDALADMAKPERIWSVFI